jgi:hypothetical protein
MTSKATQHVSVNINRLNKADVLRVLFDYAAPPPADYNKRFDHKAYDAPIDKAEADRLIEQQLKNSKGLNFDSIYGRTIRADLNGSNLDLTDYAYQNPGALEKVKGSLQELHAGVTKRFADALQINANKGDKTGAAYLSVILNGGLEEPKISRAR